MQDAGSMGRSDNTGGEFPAARCVCEEREVWGRSGPVSPSRQHGTVSKHFHFFLNSLLIHSSIHPLDLFRRVLLSSFCCISELSTADIEIRKTASRGWGEQKA